MQKILAMTVFAAGFSSAAVAQTKREVGTLVLDGVGEIPKRITERSFQYTNARSATLLDWDPRGEGILVATRFGETAQIHRVVTPGADRRQLTFFSEPVTIAHFDARRSGGFYFSMDAGGSEFYQLYWYDLRNGIASLLTDGKSRNEGLLPAAHTSEIAFSSTVRNGADFDIYTMNDGDPKTTKKLLEVKGQWNALDWSADASHLLVKQEISINESHLFTVDARSGEKHALNDKAAGKIAYGAAMFARKSGHVYYTSDEDAEFQQLVRYDLMNEKKEVLSADVHWDVHALELSDDGKWIAFAVNEGGRSTLYVAATTAPQKRTKVELPVGYISALKFDRASKRVGFSLNSATAPSDVYSYDLAAKKVVRWTFSEVGGLDPDTFVVPELVEYKSFDGRKIPAWIYRPRTQAKAPVVVNIHGGPEGQSLAIFNAYAQYLVNEMHVAVIFPNVRGSSGYGKSYLQLDNWEKREDSVKDIGALLDYIATDGKLDATHVGVVGGSYGGYMSLASLTHFSDRLRCGVDIVGISNFVTFLENTKEYRRDLRRVEYGDERDPKMRTLLQHISPLTNAKQIKVPLYVQQGANDPRVPATEAEQIVKTVRANGGAVWYMLAKDEGHGFQKKRNRDFSYDSMTLFFEQFLLR